jgi:16S rRNA (uracil1498-N3)-methyltransferase
VPHFFVSPLRIRDGQFALAPEESAHLARVLRKKIGDEVRLFDGVDHSYRAVLDVVTPERVSGRILAELPFVETPFFFRLFQSVPKGDTFEWIIEKATELGVAEIVPLQTRRSVARVPAARVAAKTVRWEKIVRAAAAQCGRADIPAISPPLEFDAALDRMAKNDLSLIAWEGESSKTLKSVLSAELHALAGATEADISPTPPAVRKRGRTPPPGRTAVNVMIGPEGGFDPSEVERAAARGVRAVGLGPRILRTETAGIFVASSLLYEFGL